MNFDNYKNPLNYPRKADFTVTYYYKAGQVVATVRPGDHAPHLPAAGAKETVTDEDAYRTALGEYSKHDLRLREQFIVDILHDHGLPDNKFTRKLYAIAYEEGHSNGYSEIYNCFGNLSDLHDLAKEVYGK